MFLKAISCLCHITKLPRLRISKGKTRLNYSDRGLFKMRYILSEFSPQSFLSIMSPLLTWSHQFSKNIKSLLRLQASMKLQGTQKVARVMNGSVKMSSKMVVCIEFCDVKSPSRGSAARPFRDDVTSSFL